MFISIFSNRSGNCSFLLRPVFPLVLLFSFALAGCSKKNSDDEDDPGSSYYIRFKIDGAQKEYKSNTGFQVLPVSNKSLYSAVMNGFQDDGALDKNLLNIIIWSKDPIVAKTYKNENDVANSDGDKVPEILITYNDNDKVGHLSLGKPFSTQPPFDRIVSDAQVVITNLTGSNISGTFSGTLYKSTDGTYTQKLVVTEGKFNLKKL